MEVEAHDWVLPVMSAHVQAERNCTISTGREGGPWTVTTLHSARLGCGVQALTIPRSGSAREHWRARVADWRMGVGVAAWHACR